MICWGPKADFHHQPIQTIVQVMKEWQTRDCRDFKSAGLQKRTICEISTDGAVSRLMKEGLRQSYYRRCALITRYRPSKVPTTPQLSCNAGLRAAPITYAKCSMRPWSHSIKE